MPCGRKGGEEKGHKIIKEYRGKMEYGKAPVLRNRGKKNKSRRRNAQQKL